MEQVGGGGGIEFYRRTCSSIYSSSSNRSLQGINIHVKYLGYYDVAALQGVITN